MESDTFENEARARQPQQEPSPPGSADGDAGCSNGEDGSQSVHDLPESNEKIATKEAISRENLEEMYESTKASLERFLRLESTSNEINRVYDFDWRDELQKLTATVLEEKENVIKLSELLKQVLDVKNDKLGEDPGELALGNESEKVEPRFSSWKLNYVPWHKILDFSNPTGTYPTIDIPLEEPSISDLSSSGPTSGQPRNEDLATLKKPKGIPERIRINSSWLLRVIDNKLCDRALNCATQGVYVLLRPFKLLIYLDSKIRARLAQLEASRMKIINLSEEEYIEAYRKDPAQDTIQADDDYDFDEDKLSLSELTTTIMDFRQLVSFMDDTLFLGMKRLADIPDTVRFVDLWFLFPLGSLVYVKDANIPQKIWKVANKTGGRRYLEAPIGVEDYKPDFRPLILDCYHLDHDGTRFIQVFAQFQITGFEETRAVHDLPIVPFRVAEEKRMVPDKDTLLERSSQFIRCARTKMSHLAYSGRSLHRTPDGRKLAELADEATKNMSCYSERIDSEVIVDFDRALEEVPAWRPNASDDHVFSETYSAETTSNFGMDIDGKWDAKIRREFLDAEEQKWRAWNTLGIDPTDESDRLIFPDRIFAFVLKNRRWACLRIGPGSDGEQQLKELKQQKEPWKQLELPEGHREIVQSLLDSHFSKEKSRRVHFDVVKDKGNGVIILLHGVPGVGKTSTAECAALSNGRPLLPITCGDLGLMPGEVEDKLKEVFRLAQDWGCIMLLDEADVFLAQRTVTDHQRNALVSVFLRTLEYYEGVLFLTTNRVGVFDEAFKSRIHMTLYYPPLDKVQTKKIWNTHIEKAKNAGIVAEDSDYRELMSYAEEIFSLQRNPQYGPVWNGRQIRNAFQSAVALAAFHTRADSPVSLKKVYFENVFAVSNKFNNYIWTTKQGQSDADLNRMFMTRRDDFAEDNVSVTGGMIAVQPALQPIQTMAGFPRSTFSQGIQRSASPFGAQHHHQQQLQQQQLQQQQFQQQQQHQQLHLQPLQQGYPQQQSQFLQQQQQPQFQQQTQFAQQQNFPQQQFSPQQQFQNQQQYQQAQSPQPTSMSGVGGYPSQVGQVSNAQNNQMSGGLPLYQQQQPNVQVPVDTQTQAQSSMARSGTDV